MDKERMGKLVQRLREILAKDEISETDDNEVQSITHCIPSAKVGQKRTES